MEQLELIAERCSFDGCFWRAANGSGYCPRHTAIMHFFGSETEAKQYEAEELKAKAKAVEAQ